MSRVFATNTLAVPPLLDTVTTADALPRYQNGRTNGDGGGNSGGKGLSFPAVKSALGRDGAPTNAVHSNIQNIKASFGLALPGALASNGRTMSLKQLLAVQRARALLDQCAHLRERVLCRRQQIPSGVRDVDLDRLIEALAPMDTLQLLVEQQEAVCGPMGAPSTDITTRRLQGYAQFENSAANGGDDSIVRASGQGSGSSSPRQRARKLAPLDVAAAGNTVMDGADSPRAPAPPVVVCSYPPVDLATWPGGVQPSPPVSPPANRLLDSILSPRRTLPSISVSGGSAAVAAESIIISSRGRRFRSVSGSTLASVPGGTELSFGGKKPVLGSPRGIAGRLSPSPSGTPTTPRTPLAGGEERAQAGMMLMDGVVPSPPKTPRRTLLAPALAGDAATEGSLSHIAPPSPLRADSLGKCQLDALSEEAAVMDYILSWREGMVGEPLEEGSEDDGGWLLPPLTPILDAVWDYEDDDISGGLDTPPDVSNGTAEGTASMHISRSVSAFVLSDAGVPTAGGPGEGGTGAATTPAAALMERFPKQFFDLQWLDEMKSRINKRLVMLEESLGSLHEKKSNGRLSWDDADREAALSNEIHLLTRNKDDMEASLQQFPSTLQGVLAAYKHHMGLLQQLEDTEQRHVACIQRDMPADDGDESAFVMAAKQLEEQLRASFKAVQVALDVYSSGMAPANK